jgi:hypothetical protein
MRHAFVIASLLLIFAHAACATELGTRGGQFTINRKPAFLLGISYYAGTGAARSFVRRDLADARRYGVNWIRVWATWSAFGNDISAVDTRGEARQPALSHLEWLVGECDRRGMAVDVTLSRGPLLPSLVAHLRAAEVLTRTLKRYRNWYIDLANERDIGDSRFVSVDELRQLNEAVKRVDPRRLVTASSNIEGDLLKALLADARLDLVCPHLARNAGSPAVTEAKTREYRRRMEAIGRLVPIHYQEPFRRGYGDWQPKAPDFLTDLRGAIAGGAAGWCLHNGSTRGAPDEQPRRSFDLREKRLFDQLDAEEIEVLRGAGGVQRLDLPR